MATPPITSFVCDEGYENCPSTCVGAEACLSCPCRPSYGLNSPGGSGLDVFICLLPIAMLLVVTLKPSPWPTTLSLPVSALCMLAIKLMYLGADVTNTFALCLAGLHEAFTPLSIVAGAMFLFETLDVCGCMSWMMAQMKVLSKQHPVAEVMLVGWAFAYLVEGASGFGTPAALAAPMLAKLGHDEFESVLALLLMNMFATMFGAVGTPVWFGFGGLDLTEEELLTVGFRAAVCVGITACVLVPLVVCILVPRRVVLENIGFIYLSLCSCVVPSVAMSTFSYEFPTIGGGLIGVLVTALLVHFSVLLKAPPATEKEAAGADIEEAAGLPAEAEAAAVAEATLEGNEEESIGEVAADKDKNSLLPSAVRSISRERRARGRVVREYSRPPRSLSRKCLSRKSSAGSIDAKMSIRSAEPFDPNREQAGNPLFVAFSMRSYVDDETLVPSELTGVAFVKELLLQTFPLTLTVLLLIVTRLEPLGLRGLLQRKEPSFTLHLGSYGDFSLSASLVFQLRNILTDQTTKWTYAALYIPCIIPFGLCGSLALWVFRDSRTDSVRDILARVLSRMVSPAKALLGSLVLVQLIRGGGEAAPGFIIGSNLAGALKEGWLVVSFLIGALGSFFSGSTTVSNLTFGDVQLVAAESIGIDPESMLALQLCGATAGNAVCIANIVSACAVIGLTGVVGEGAFIKHTGIFVLAFGVISTLATLALFIRF
ncbi:unnamed protein product [Chrysoparadoxa australica]